MINGDEYDALTKGRHLHRWRAGELRQIKRAYRKRERRMGLKAVALDAE